MERKRRREIRQENDRKEKERRRKIEKWTEEKRRREVEERKEREIKWKDTVLIIKRGKKARKSQENEMWIKEKIGVKEVKIIRGMDNKEAAKVFFRDKEDRDEVWERRKCLKERFDMMIDKWLTIEERRKRFEKMDKIKELRRKIKESTGGIEVNIEYELESDYMKVGERKYRWRGDRWTKV